MTHPIETSVDALSTLLEAERDALLQGDLMALTEMLPDKEALISVLNDEGGRDLPALQALDRKVRRNQVLLDGALDGIREVSTRVAVLQRMRDGLETYGSDGTKQNIKVRTGHSVERRA